jgi:hypothetical protein
MACSLKLQTEYVPNAIMFEADRQHFYVEIAWELRNVSERNEVIDNFRNFVIFSSVLKWWKTWEKLI